MGYGLKVMVFNATIFQFYSWRKLSTRKNHWPAAIHWQTITMYRVHFTMNKLQTHNFSDDRHGFRVQQRIIEGHFPPYNNSNTHVVSEKSFWNFSWSEIIIGLAVMLNFWIKQNSYKMLMTNNVTFAFKWIVRKKIERKGINWRKEEKGQTDRSTKHYTEN
jgi:hypothetical protein